MLLDLVAAVRAAGVPATPDRVQAMVRAIDATGPDLLYWAARLTLCGSPDDIARFDAAFAGFTRDAEPRGTPWQVRRLPERTLFRANTPGDEAVAGDPGLAVRAADAEVLRHRDLATLSAVERAEAVRLLTLAASIDPRRAGRRYRPWHRGRPDPRRTMRAM